MLDIETNTTSRQLPSGSHQNSKMTAPSSLSPPYYSSDDEFLLTSFWLSHYLVSQLLFLRHSLFDLQPSANQRRGGRSGAGPGVGGRGLSLMISAPWTDPRLLPLDCREATLTHNWMIFQEKPPSPDPTVHGTELLSLFDALLSPPRLSWFFFSPGPSVESSRVLTALSLRLQVDFSPLLVFLSPAKSTL